MTICRHGAVCIWLDAGPHEEFNAIKIIFTGQSMRMLLPRSVRPTQHEQNQRTIELECQRSRELKKQRNREKSKRKIEQEHEIIRDLEYHIMREPANQGTR